MKKTFTIVVAIGMILYALLAAGCADTIYAVTVSEPPSAEESTAQEGTATPTEAPQSAAPQTSAPEDSAAAEPSAGESGSLSPEQLRTLEQPLAALLAASIVTGEDYGATATFGTMYLHMLVDMFYGSEAREYSEIQSDAYSEFVRLSGEEVAQLLQTAFGSSFQASQVTESVSLIVQDGYYYFGIGDSGISVNVSYAGEADGGARYTYSAQVVGTDAVNGELTAQVNEGLQISGYTLEGTLPQIGA